MAIELPDFDRAFDYENNFYLSCRIDRISKLLAHYELYKLVQDRPGAIVECGVFKGTSLVRFATFRELLGSPYSKPILGFDTFGAFPQTDFEPDRPFRDLFVKNAGEQSISTSQLDEILKRKGAARAIELVEGDIAHTVPEYVEKHPELRISLLNLDTDIYEPSKVVLEYLYPRLVRGGVLLLDDYGTFPGETQAVEEYFAATPIRLQKFPFCTTPCYLVKE